MKKYKLFELNGQLGCIKRLNDAGNEYNTSIPINEENIDYQEYLAWVEEGNTPESADE